MKIKVVSDLHLEFSPIRIENDGADVLILSGDIMIADHLHTHLSVPNMYAQPGELAKLSYKQQNAREFREFFKQCSENFKHVIYVMGNHEFYDGKWLASIEHMREEVAQYPNIYMLERDVKVIDDVVFMGGTLWTDLNKADPLTIHALKDLMNDFKIIRNESRSYARVSPEDTAYRHRLTLGYFKHILDENKDKTCVVVTHHSPSLLSIHEMYKDDTLMNGGYHSDLSEFILDHPQIKLWTHGHTHFPYDYTIGDTRIVCNPRGYESDRYSEHSGWNPNLILEI